MVYLEIDIKNLYELENIQVIDLRDTDKYQKYHLSNSINVSYDNLLINPERYLDKNKKYLLVCDYGLKSKKTSEILNNNGYLTFSLHGGIRKLMQKEKK